MNTQFASSEFITRQIMKTSTFVRRLLSWTAIASFILFASQHAHAAVKTWVGNTSNLTATAANWGTAFASGDSMTFAVPGTAGSILTNDLAAGTNVAGITFTNNATTGNYTISGNAINLTGNITSGALVTANQTINLNMAMSANRTFSVSNGSSTMTLGGIISDGGSGFNFTRGGTGGTVKLTGANTFTGNVILTSGSGTLSVSADNNLGAGNTVYMAQNAGLATTSSFSTSKNFVLAAGGVSQDITPSAGTILTINGIISSAGAGGGGYRINGGGTVILTAANTTNASLTVLSNVILQGAGTFGNGTNGLSLNAGTADLGGTSQTVGAFSMIGTSTNTLSNGTLTATSYSTTSTAGTSTVSAILAGSGAFTQNNAGKIILAANNTYTGATTIGSTTTNGTLQIGNGGATGALSTSSAITNNALLVFSRNNTITQGTDFANVISGTGSVTQNGTGTLVLNGANTYAGTTRVSLGTLQAGIADVAGVSGALGNGGNITFTGGALQYTASSAGSDYSARFKNSTSAISVDTNSQTVRLASVIDSTNAGGLTKQGAGILTLAGANTYTGNTTISAGTLALDSSGAIGSSGNIVFGGGTLQYSANNTTDYSSRIASGTSASAVSIDTNGQSVTFATGLTGSQSGGITKLGAGTLTLAGSNANTGGTTISAGTIQYGIDNAINSASNVLLNSGTAATLALNGHSGTIASLTMGGAAGTAASTYTVSTGAGTLSLGGGITTVATGNYTTAAVISGKLDVGAANRNVTVANSTGTATDLDIQANISGTGGLLYNSGSGLLRLSGTGNTFTGDFGWSTSGLGDIYVASLGNGSGNIKIFQNEALHTTASITTTKGLVLGGLGQINQDIYVDSGTFTIGGLVTDNAAVTTSLYRKLGVGDLVFTNDANTTATKVQINAGNISVTSIKNVGLNSALGNPQNASQGTINIGASTTSAGLIYTGTGDSTDRVINLYGTTGGATINQSGTGLLKFTSNFTATSNGAKALTLTGSTAGTGEIAGVIVDSAAGATRLNKTGTGIWTLSGVNTYTGNTTVSGGAIVISADSGLGAAPGVATAAHLILNSGGLVTTGTMVIDQNRGILLQGSGGQINVGSGTQTTYGGIISGTALQKAGTGVLLLGGANDYTGVTQVTAGTLVVNGNQSGATGAVTIDAGATLGGSGTIGGATTISGTHNPGNSPGLQTFVSDLSYMGTSTFNFELNSNTVAGRGTNYDGVDVGGNLSITAGANLNLVFDAAGSGVAFTNAFWNSDQTWNIFAVTGTTTGAFALNSISLDSLGAAYTDLHPLGSFNLQQVGNNVNLNWVAVPEPAAWLLAAFGLTTAVVFRRRRME